MMDADGRGGGGGGGGLAEALFGVRRPPPAVDLWQARECRFDAPPAALALRRGEELLLRVDGVEDSKGNPGGGTGTLCLTTLRLVWRSSAKARTSLSIGLDAVTGVAARPAASRLTLPAPPLPPSSSSLPHSDGGIGRGGRGAATMLVSTCLLARHGGARYEFVFTPLHHHGARVDLYRAVTALLAAFDASRPQRELRLRGALLAPDGELALLPRETAFARVAGVVNLTANNNGGGGGGGGGTDASSVGTLVVTSARLVWCSDAAAAYHNASIPFLAVRSRAPPTRAGPALVVETWAATAAAAALPASAAAAAAAAGGSGHSGGMVLGFRIQPRETLEYVARELASLLAAAHAAPQFGVDGAAVVAAAGGGGGGGGRSRVTASTVDVGRGDGGDDDDGGDEEGCGDDDDDGDEYGEGGGGGGGGSWAAAAYADGVGGGADGGADADDAGGADEPVFSAELGLAIEAPRDGASVASLWSVL